MITASSPTLIFGVLLSIILLFSCDNGETERMNLRNQTLVRKIDELKSNNDWLADKVHSLESDLSSCKHDLHQEEIMVTDLLIVSKMTAYGFTHVYGMQNAIRFLSDHYCTHFEYEISSDQVDRSFQNPIIIR
jgi:hypothetical protein